jgi:ribose transport system substrate-binding protein
LSAALVLGFSGVGVTAASATTHVKAGGKVSIGVVITGIAMYPYYQAEVKGIKAEAAKLGKQVSLTILDCQGSSQLEKSNMQQVINEHVNAIIYTAGDAAVGKTETAAAKAAGIPVIGVDRVAGPAESAYVGYNNVTLGADMANYVVKQLNGKGTVGEEIGVPGVVNVTNREQGWKNVFAKNPGITVAGVVTTNFDPGTAFTVTQALLTGHPNIKWLLVMDDNTALGTIRAVKASGKHIKVMGLGGQTVGIKAVENGSMAATVLMKPYQLGQVGLSTAVKIVYGEKYVKVPTFSNPVVTKSNAAQLLKQTGVGW